MINGTKSACSNSAAARSAYCRALVPSALAAVDQLPGPDDQHTDVRVALGHRVIYVDVSVVHPTAVSYRLTASRRTLSTIRRARSGRTRRLRPMAVREIVCHTSDEMTKIFEKTKNCFCACTFYLHRTKQMAPHITSLQKKQNM